jgi:hypothetical protein
VRGVSGMGWGGEGGSGRPSILRAREVRQPSIRVHNAA